MKYLLIILFGLSIVAKPSSCNKKAVPDNGDGFYHLDTKMNLKGFSKDCKHFIKGEVRQKWKLHESGECFYDDQPFWESVLGKQDCFIGKSKEQIESIFGSPHKINASTNHKSTNCKYYMGKVCEKDYPYFNLQFLYDENNILVKIGQGQITHN
jgi:hypothetical protein